MKKVLKQELDEMKKEKYPFIIQLIKVFLITNSLTNIERRIVLYQ
jgi:hypothetical protein